jgi:hypothetical protein
VYDIFGVPPFQTAEQKLTARKTKEEAVNYARNLSAYGYTNLRVTEHVEQAPPPAPAEEPAPQDKQ